MPTSIYEPVNDVTILCSISVELKIFLKFFESLFRIFKINLITKIKVFIITF